MATLRDDVVSLTGALMGAVSPSVVIGVGVRKTVHKGVWAWSSMGKGISRVGGGARRCVVKRRAKCGGTNRVGSLGGSHTCKFSL
jgi:hypothetical protein